MIRPTVHQAHAIRDLLKVRAVIILALSEDNVAGASYGETKKECKETAYTMDRIIEDIQEGRIPVWSTRETEAIRCAKIVRDGIADGSYCAVCEVPIGDCDCDGRGAYKESDDERGALCPDSPDGNHYIAPIGSNEEWAQSKAPCYYCGEKQVEL